MPCESKPSTITFEHFHLDRRRRQLFVENTKLPLHARALDVLEFLIDNRDRIVSHDEIMKNVWRGVTVSENNLTVQLSAVRRHLAAHGGADLIVTIVGRGYRFAGDVIEHSAPPADRPHILPSSGGSAIFSGRPFPRRKANLAGQMSFLVKLARSEAR